MLAVKEKRREREKGEEDGHKDRYLIKEHFQAEISKLL